MEFKECESIIKAKSKLFSKIWRVDFDDLYSQSSLLFVIARSKWNKDRSTFKTYLNYYLKEKLKEYIYNFYLKERKFTIPITNEIKKTYIHDQTILNLSKNLKNKLSLDILNVVINKPYKVSNNYKTKITMNSIRKYYSGKGYGGGKINKAISLIQRELSS